MGKRKKAGLPDIGGLSLEQLALLLAGRGRGAKWRSGVFESPEEAWQTNREELIRFWQDPRLAGQAITLPMRGGPTLTPSGPGHMPWAFWAYEAPEPRRLVLDNGMTTEIWTQTWCKGFRVDWEQRGRGRFDHGIPTHHPPGVEFESGRAYLARLGLVEEETTPGGGDGKE